MSAALPDDVAELVSELVASGCPITYGHAGVIDPPTVDVVDVPESLWPRLRAAAFQTRQRPRGARNAWQWCSWTSHVYISRTPEPGMPMTYGIGADEYGGVVTRVERNGRWVFYRLNRIDEERKGVLLRTGDYRPVGGCGYLHFGHASDRLDPSF